MDYRDEDSLLQESKTRVPGWAGAALQMALIEKGGSDRHYYRVTARGGASEGGPASAVLMVYTDRRADNASFFPATEVLSLAGARAPVIHYHDALRRVAWIEDLGRNDLWEYRLDDAVRVPLYRSALRQVARLHSLDWEAIPDRLRASMQPAFDEALYRWEQDYFFDQFAARFSAAPAERLAAIRQLPEFAELCRDLAARPRSPVHRDFQSQNVIVRGEKVWMIDYQGLRQGLPEYDLASLLYDPYVRLTAAEREELRDYYFAVRGPDSDCSAACLAMCACQRLMQALGAYGKLGSGDGKTAFLRHIPPALENLRGVLRAGGLLPALEEVLYLRPGALPEEILEPDPEKRVTPSPGSRPDPVVPAMTA